MTFQEETYTCWNCIYRLNEECDLTGREVYVDSIPCDNFDLKGEEDGN
jgi:hypothetical protein